MKATGIVRRLDDLGRLVIPKEIRKIYKLKEGDSIEFFVNEDSEIVLKKFSVLSDETESITRMCQTLQEVTEHPVLFVEDDQILCVGQAKLDEWRSQSLSVEFQECVKAYHVRPFDQVRLFAAKPETFKERSSRLRCTATGWEPSSCWRRILRCSRSIWISRRRSAGC